MESVSSCEDKLQHFRIRELKDVLTQLGLSKQGKKQDLVDRILAVLADDQVSMVQARKKAMGKVEVAKLVDDTYRKMHAPAAADPVTKPHIVVDNTPVKPKEEIDDSPQCNNEKCQIWEHISCVIIPEEPTGGAPPVPRQFYCELCRLNRADPFLLTTTHPLCPVKLMIINIPTDGANPVQGVEKTFQITALDKLLMSVDEYDVQAWCMLLNDEVPFRIQWPQYAYLQVNGVAVCVTNRSGPQMLGANGRDDGPFISVYTREGENKISLTGCDSRFFCLGVRMVRRRTLQQVRNMIPREFDGERFEDALTRVRRCLNGGGDTDNGDSDGDLEVVSNSITLSLRCPVSGSRMKVAGRFRPCVHIGCFDLETFVEMQQKSRKWQCPICLINYSLEHLIIDPYINRITTMMRSCREDTTDIEVRPDGSWRVRGGNERWDFRQWHFPDGSSTDVEVGKRENMNTSSGKALQDYLINYDWKVSPTSSSTTASGIEGEDKSINQDTKGNFNFAADTLESMHRDTDIIVLSDSDDEDAVTTLPHNTQACVSGANSSVVPDGLPNAHQEDLTYGASGNLNLFNGSTAVAPHTVDGHSNNSYFNNSLIDNPLAFGGEDPSLQIFLPARPSKSTAPTSVRHHQDSSGGIQCEDWTSVRLGDDSGRTVMTNGPNAGNQLRSEGTKRSLADTDGIRSDGSRRRPDTPISFPQQQHPVRPRIYLSIDSDSD